MTAFVSAEFIAELDDAIKTGSPERRLQILRRVTGLFLASAERLNAFQIGVFDDVLVRLIGPADARTLAKFSSALSDLTSAPRETVRQLACHEDATVATPLLLKAESLSGRDLVEIANNRSQQHLLAVSERKSLHEALTDAILKRGDTNVCRALAKNISARLSEQGYSILVAAAERDDDIADSLVLRSDLPVKMLHELLANASKAVRTRLLDLAPTEMHETIHAAIESIAAQESRKKPRLLDYGEAKSNVLALNKTGKLKDSTVNHFAVHGERLNLVAALSLLATVEIEMIEALIEEISGYGLMVACRASRLDWQTASAIASNRAKARPFQQQEQEQLKKAYQALSLSVAQRMIRFGSARDFAHAMQPHAADNTLAIGAA